MLQDDVQLQQHERHLFGMSALFKKMFRCLSRHRSGTTPLCILCLSLKHGATNLSPICWSPNDPMSHVCKKTAPANNSSCSALVLQWFDSHLKRNVILIVIQFALRSLGKGGSIYLFHVHVTLLLDFGCTYLRRWSHKTNAKLSSEQSILSCMYVWLSLHNVLTWCYIFCFRMLTFICTLLPGVLQLLAPKESKGTFYKVLLWERLFLMLSV